MLTWYRKRREAEQRAADRAERLIGDLGAGAYAEARRRERAALDDDLAHTSVGSRLQWRA